MSVENSLLERAAAKCELCKAENNLSVYDVKPNSGPNPDTSVLLCEFCLQHLADPAAIGKHWYCLNESAWSEVPAVQVLTYRILKSLQSESWASDLASQMYFDEETQKWADAGLGKEDSLQTPTLDSNGSVLQAGDTVTLIKDLVVKGANFTAKRGTVVKNISLTDDPKLIEGRVNGTHIVLVASYLKKA
ncbi:MAG: PhnA domain-containing protein [Oligoflexus sp.]